MKYKVGVYTRDGRYWFVKQKGLFGLKHFTEPTGCGVGREAAIENFKKKAKVLKDIEELPSAYRPEILEIEV